MGAFRFSPGNCGTSPCACGTCSGSLSGSLVGACTTADRAGQSVTAYIAGTSTAVSTTSTAGDGTFTLLYLPHGVAYDVVATRDGCSSAKWTAQYVPGCGVYPIGSLSTYCFPGAGRKFVVTGCFGTALPGATVTVSGAGALTMTTNSSGVATYFPYALGVYNWTVTDPSDRFTTASGTWTQSGECDSGEVDVSMTPTSDYQCCDIQKTITPPSPYPIPKTLKLTDPGGTISFTASVSCGVSNLCAERTMDHCASCGGSTCNSVSCHDGGLANQPPTIGSLTSVAYYTVTLTSSSAAASQSNHLAPGLAYRAAWTTDGNCTPVDTVLTWRVASTCALPGAGYGTWNSTGYTINSLYPLNITFTFDNTGSWGPAVYGTILYGQPFAPSLVLSE